MSNSGDQFDEQMMRRAFRLAMNGRGRSEPNPSVGCILVKAGRIIGEGHTQTYGGAHAEPTALANCVESPHGATAYVTLEPCCHTNKQTPPCTPRLIEAKIARIVYGCTDPNPDVDGKGLQQLRDAGIEVVGPILESEAKQLIAPFLIWTKTRRPYVTLKWAQTADGKVAGPGGTRIQISNPESMQIVHQLRARCDGILVGINTVISDNPLLLARHVEATRQLRRIVLDSELRIPLESQLVQTSKLDPVNVFCSVDAFEREMEKVQLLREQQVHLQTFKRNSSETGLPLRRVLERCDGVVHLLVEPGPTLSAQFFKDGLADRLWIFRSSNSLNSDSAPSTTPIPESYIQTGQIKLGNDTLTEYLNPKSDSFFAPVPSADLILAQESRLTSD